jgi:FkbM family methyltransferase
MFNRIYSFLKSRALRVLPESVLQPLRVWHHRRVLGSFSDAEEPDLVVIRHLVQRGTIAVDLGANFGMYTKVLSDLVGPAGKVISVEPVPQTFEALSRNVQRLGMRNVTCVNVAISDSDGDVVMELPDYETGGINFYQATVVARARDGIDSSRQVRVPALRLDTVIAGKGVVGFVKCDVESHELACLSGAKNVLNSHGPAWLVEVSGGDPDDADSNARQVFNIFEDLAYSAWWFDGKRLNKRRQGDRSTNYFFLKESHAARLRDAAPQFFRDAQF